MTVLGETIGEGFAAMRDASWYRKPGVAWVYHVATENWNPCCNKALYPAGVILDHIGARPAAEIPAGMRCRRRGCRERWPDDMTASSAVPDTSISG